MSITSREALAWFQKMLLVVQVQRLARAEVITADWTLTAHDSLTLHQIR